MSDWSTSPWLWIVVGTLLAAVLTPLNALILRKYVGDEWQRTFTNADRIPFMMIVVIPVIALTLILSGLINTLFSLPYSGPPAIALGLSISICSPLTSFLLWRYRKQ